MTFCYVLKLVTHCLYEGEKATEIVMKCRKMSENVVYCRDDALLSPSRHPPLVLSSKSLASLATSELLCMSVVVLLHFLPSFMKAL